MFSLKSRCSTFSLRFLKSLVFIQFLSFTSMFSLSFSYLTVTSKPSTEKFTKIHKSKIKSVYDQTLGTGERLLKNLSLSESDKQQLATTIFTTFKEEERFNSLVFFFRYALLKGFDPLLFAAKDAYLLGGESEGDKHLNYLSGFIQILDFIADNFSRGVDVDNLDLDSDTELFKALVAVEHATDLAFIVTDHLEEREIHQIHDWDSLKLLSLYFQYFEKHLHFIEDLLGDYEIILHYLE